MKIWDHQCVPRNADLQLLLFCCFLPFTTTIHAAKPPITSVAFAPGGDSLVAVSQLGLQVYSWPKLELRQTLQTASSNLHCVAFSPDGKHIAAGGGDPSEVGRVELFSWPKLERISEASTHEDSVRAIAWLGNTEILSGGLDRQILSCGISKTKPTRSFQGHSRGVAGLAYLDEHKVFVSVADDQSVRVWDAPNGELIHSLSQHTKPIHSVALRPATEGLPMVASAAADRTIRFWQPTIGRMVRYIRLPVEPLDIAWTRDGEHILAVCVDGHIRVIDPINVTIRQNIPTIDGWAYTIAVHPSDGTVVIGGANGQLRRVSLDSQ